ALRDVARRRDHPMALPRKSGCLRALGLCSPGLGTLLLGVSERTPAPGPVAPSPDSDGKGSLLALSRGGRTRACGSSSGPRPPGHSCRARDAGRAGGGERRSEAADRVSRVRKACPLARRGASLLEPSPGGSGHGIFRLAIARSASERE